MAGAGTKPVDDKKGDRPETAAPMDVEGVEAGGTEEAAAAEEEEALARARSAVEGKKFAVRVEDANDQVSWLVDWLAEGEEGRSDAA